MTRLRNSLAATAQAQRPTSAVADWLLSLLSSSSTSQMLQDVRVGPPAPSSSGSSPAADHAQSSRRIFVGPMPHSVRGAEHDDSEAADFVRQHGLRIFLQQGGHIEEWTEAKAKEYKERLKERILESAAWYAVAGSKKNKWKKKSMKPTVEWKGDSFEIGKVVGVSVNMLAAHEESLYSVQDMRHSSDRSISRKESAATVHWDGTSRPSFVTARSTLSSIGSPRTPGSPLLKSLQSAPAAPLLSVSSEDTHSEGNDNIESTSSRTPLFSDAASHSLQHASPTETSKLRGAKSEGDLPRTARTGLKSILTSPGKDKGKGKAVRYAKAPTKGPPSGSQSPVPPEEVLGRSPLEVEDSSASAAASAAASESNVEVEDDGDRVKAILRDKMLVRIFRCSHENLESPFVEQGCRITRGLDSKEWDEFLIIWRKHRIELYENYRMPCKERILGHKHLAFVIPLSAWTKLSIFSSVDLSFCLICPPTPTKFKKDRGHRSIFHRSSRGLNVFVLKPKSRSRAVDWIWNLWIELGGMLPDSIEVSCPLVHSRVSIPIPDTGEDWKVLTRDFVIDQCSQAMEGSFAWQTVIQLPILNGRRLELCWRSGTNLDWVWLKDDVDVQKRDWEVLFGIAMNYLGGPAQLELHLASHYPALVTTKDGKHLEEPPSIEGFVHAYKRKTQTRVQYYLSTHDGYLCAIQVEKVVPPPTPTDIKSFSKSEEEVREDEHVRLRMQIMNARWFWDLRNVLAVRRASFVVAQIRDESVQPQTGEPRNSAETPEIPTMNVQNGEHELRRTESDIGDEGGDTGLAAAVDKGRLRMHRSFELVLKNGRILRFETHSTKIAVEWVTHLRALVEYWTKRYHADTATEMNIFKESLGNDRITVSRRYYKNGSRLATPSQDAENASLYMGEYWNWCVLDGCRQIVKSGRLFMKSKFRGQYKHAHLILIRGCLVQFRVSNDFSMHNHQIGRINLIDAYVCSGYYAALALPQEECDPNAPPVAKLFPDGLETRDLAEDTLFMLWYRPHVNYAKGDFNKIPIPPMSSKHKVVVFRAQSKLERDVWCWALSCEIERLVRQTQDRENRTRERGMPI